MSLPSPWTVKLPQALMQVDGSALQKKSRLWLSLTLRARMKISKWCRWERPHASGRIQLLISPKTHRRQSTSKQSWTRKLLNANWNSKRIKPRRQRKTKTNNNLKPMSTGSHKIRELSRVASKIKSKRWRKSMLSRTMKSVRCASSFSVASKRSRDSILKSMLSLFKAPCTAKQQLKKSMRTMLR